MPDPRDSRSDAEEMAAILADEFNALHLASHVLRASGKVPDDLDDDDLLGVLAQLRVARGLDDLMLTLVDLQEAKAASQLLQIVGDDDSDEDFDDDEFIDDESGGDDDGTELNVDDFDTYLDS